MWSLITSNLAKIFGGLGAVIATALTVYLGGRKAGSNASDNRVLKQNEENANVRQEVDRTVARANNAAEQLRNDWARD